MKRLLVPSAALWWGLQFAFLNPALALLLVSLLDASPADVGWVLVALDGPVALIAVQVLSRGVHRLRGADPRGPGHDSARRPAVGSR